MAVIVIHAGMPKTGSTSIQRWVAKSAKRLREGGFTVAVAPRDASREIAFVPYEEGDVETGWMVEEVARAPQPAPDRTADALTEALAGCAERYGNTIVSSEHFAIPFWRLHERTLTGFERLSREHELRIAYYARPQHSSLEAAWRQAGYRTGMPASTYIAENATRMDYAATRRGVRQVAPRLGFEPRPFRSDLLHRGDVVSDFAHNFLDFDLHEPADWVNRSLPLEVVNVLRAAPPHMFWHKSYGNLRISRIKSLLAGEHFPEDDRVALSRQVLRKYAHENFAEGNAELGWEGFVPPPEDPDRVPGLEALDWLWTPSASPAELAMFFRALRAAI